MIDYNSIIESLIPEKIIELMTSLGADRYKETDKEIIFPTICHHEDAAEASMKLYYYKDSHNFYCYSEDGAMSIFKFLKTYYELRHIDYDWYQDILQVILNCTPSSSIKPNVNIYKPIREEYIVNNRPQLPTYPNGVLDCFIKSYPQVWLDEGITKQAMDKYNIRFSSARNKIIIPHYNINNELVGIRGRALDPDEVEQFGKYMPVEIENKWYSHPLSLNLYGLNFNKDNIRKHRVALIFEGEKSVMLMENIMKDNCAVASCGSNLNKFQVKLLMENCKPQEIVICYDNEELLNSDNYFNKLSSICQKYSNYANFSFIYDFNGLTQLKDAPIDKGQEIFYKLLNRRVKI